MLIELTGEYFREIGIATKHRSHLGQKLYKPIEMFCKDSVFNNIILDYPLEDHMILLDNNNYLESQGKPNAWQWK